MRPYVRPCCRDPEGNPVPATEATYAEMATRLGMSVDEYIKELRRQDRRLAEILGEMGAEP